MITRTKAQVTRTESYGIVNDMSWYELTKYKMMLENLPIETIKVGMQEEAKELEIDDLANMTPLMDDNRYKSFSEDIKTSGQLEPAILRNGKIIDGRHRYKACCNWSIDFKYQEVGNISDEEALKLVASKTKGKASSPTQLAAEALKYKEKAGCTLEEAAVELGVGLRTLKRLSYCIKREPKYLDIFLAGDGIEIYSEKYEKKIVCASIKPLYETIKYNELVGVKAVKQKQESTTSYDRDVNDMLQTEEAKDFFWNRYHHIKFSMWGIECFDYIDLANLSFPRVDEENTKSDPYIDKYNIEPKSVPGHFSNKQIESAPDKIKVEINSFSFGEEVLIGDDLDKLAELMKNTASESNREAFVKSLIRHRVKKDRLDYQELKKEYAQRQQD